MPKPRILFRPNAERAGKCTTNRTDYIRNFKLECKRLFINLISLKETRVDVKNLKEKCPTRLSFLTSREQRHIDIEDQN